MAIHPLLEVFLILASPHSGIWPDFGAGLRSALGAKLHAGRCVTILLLRWRKSSLSKAAGERGSDGKQQERCRANEEPGWTMPVHILCGTGYSAAMENG